VAAAGAGILGNPLCFPGVKIKEKGKEGSYRNVSMVRRGIAGPREALGTVQTCCEWKVTLGILRGAE